MLLQTIVSMTLKRFHSDAHILDWTALLVVTNCATSCFEAKATGIVGAGSILLSTFWRVN